MRLARAGRRDAFTVCLFGGNYLVSCYRFINVSFLLFGRAEVIEEEERDRQLFYGFFFSYIYIILTPRTCLRVFLFLGCRYSIIVIMTNVVQVVFRVTDGIRNMRSHAGKNKSQLLSTT